MDFIIEFLSNTLGSRLASFLGSMIPLIELKGSIMFARSASLSFFEALFYSYLGSTLVFFALFFLLKPLLSLLKKWKPFYHLAVAVEDYFSSKAEGEMTKVKGDGDFKKTLAVFIFVAIPLPMTGVWTGTAIAVFLGLDFKKSLLSVALGNLVAGLLISILAELFLPYVDAILYALLAVALIMLIIFIVKLALKIKQVKKED